MTYLLLMEPAEKPSLPKKPSIEKYVLVLLILVAIVSLMYQHKNVVYAKLDALKLIPRPERFTELYFNDHINLPKYIQKGEKISFSFVIHNLEGGNRQYPYAVYFKSLDGQITNIEKKVVVLRDEEYKTINESYTSALADNNGGIYVELQNPQQGIDFLLADKQPL